MIKYCLDRWNKNKKMLQSELETRKGLNACDYGDLVKLVVHFILNGGDDDDYESYQTDRITKIDDGDYLGTLLFLIPKNLYQPAEYEYLMTYVGYGSCSGCDTLLSIQGYEDEALLTNNQVKDYMTLCKDIVTNMIRPYNCGWREDEEYATVKE